MAHSIPILKVARGTGAILGPFLVANLFDATGSYALGNLAGCISLTCSVICMVFVMKLHNRQLAESPML